MTIGRHHLQPSLIEQEKRSVKCVPRLLLSYGKDGSAYQGIQNRSRDHHSRSVGLGSRWKMFLGLTDNSELRGRGRYLHPVILFPRKVDFALRQASHDIK